MSDSIVLNVFSVNLYKVAVLVDLVRNQRRVVGNDDQFAGSGEVSVIVVELEEGVSLSIHLASDCFVVSGGQIKPHGLAGVHLNGEECLVSEIENSGAVLALSNFPDSRGRSVVGPGEVYGLNVVVSVGTRYPNFVGLVVASVVSYVYVVSQGLFVNSLPGVFQLNLEVYSVWHDLIGVFLVGSVVVSGSFVQLSVINQLSNALGFLDEVDGPMFVNVAGVVTVVNHNFVVVSNFDVWFVNNIVGSFFLSQVDGNGYVFDLSRFASFSHLGQFVIDFLNQIIKILSLLSEGLAVYDSFSGLNGSLNQVAILVLYLNGSWDVIQLSCSLNIASYSTFSLSTNYNCAVIFSYNITVYCQAISRIYNNLDGARLVSSRSSFTKGILILRFTECEGKSRSISNRIIRNTVYGLSVVCTDINPRLMSFHIGTPISTHLNFNIANIFFNLDNFTRRWILGFVPFDKVRLIQSDAAYSVSAIFTFFVGVVPYILIVSIQRHPDGVAWLEVNRLAVVQSGRSFLNDVAIFVGYKQLAIELEVGRPVCFVLRASAIGNGESVRAHAKYHSRSQCYGKYFFFG